MLFDHYWYRIWFRIMRNKVVCEGKELLIPAAQIQHNSVPDTLTRSIFSDSLSRRDGEIENRTFDFYKMTWYCKIHKDTYPLSKFAKIYDNISTSHLVQEIWSHQHNQYTLYLIIIEVEYFNLLRTRLYGTCSTNLMCIH